MTMELGLLYLTSRIFYLAFLSRISHFYLAFLSHISHFYLTSCIFISHLAFFISHLAFLSHIFISHLAFLSHISHFYLASRIFYLASRICLSRISHFYLGFNSRNFFLLSLTDFRKMHMLRVALNYKWSLFLHFKIALLKYI